MAAQRGETRLLWGIGVRRLDIIPVIDLKGGQVVRAQRGERNLYAPIKTPLSPTSLPPDVVAGFLGLHQFRAIYVADLDAIEGRGPHAACIAELEAAFPKVRFWVDAGISTSAEAQVWLGAHRGDLVLGSETLRDAGLIARLSALPRSLLSLDFRGEEFQGPAQLAEDKTLWPQRVIVMTLGRVGSHAGPDLDRLGQISARAADRHAIYAAGGVRGPEDLRLLSQAGIAGVLVASALHDGRIGAKDLEKTA
jgi:phosphoribosylformimino-5-aminoimidazole carboxamide ribotide isomerase